METLSSYLSLNWNDIVKLYDNQNEYVRSKVKERAYKSENCIQDTLFEVAKRKSVRLPGMPIHYYAKDPFTVSVLYYELAKQWPCFVRGKPDRIPERIRMDTSQFTDERCTALASGGQSNDPNWQLARGELLIKGSKALSYTAMRSPYSDAMLESAIAQGIILDPFKTNFVIERGRQCENPVRNAYCAWLSDRMFLHNETTVEVRKRGILLPPIKKLRFFGSSPDGLLIFKRPLECTRAASLEIKVGKLYDVVRPDWMAQIQLEMLLENTAHTHLVFSQVGKGPHYPIIKLRRVVVKRDWQYLLGLLQHLFTYAACHLNHIPPFDDIMNSLPKLPEIYIQGSSFTTIDADELLEADQQTGGEFEKTDD